MCISSALYTHPEHQDPSPELVEYKMEFNYRGSTYRVFGTWCGDDWTADSQAYTLDVDGQDDEEVYKSGSTGAYTFWGRAAEVMMEDEYNKLEEL